MIGRGGSRLQGGATATTERERRGRGREGGVLISRREIDSFHLGITALHANTNNNLPFSSSPLPPLLFPPLLSSPIS
jgi:hypothetical protein